MIGCLCYFCWRQHFCPTSISDPQEPFKWHKKIFEFSCFLVTFRDFEGSRTGF